MSAKTKAVALGLKRAADIAGAGTFLVALSPVLAFVALAVKAQGIGPVVFTQQRLGKGQQPFTIYKFRSMRDSSGSDMSERLTPFTRWLRRYSLDELPQLFNVLKGDMSLVGPRPSDHMKPHKEIYDMRPGITGLAQIMGRNMVAPVERAELERRYVENWSLAQDLRIVARTVPVWLQATGYVDPDSAVYQTNIREHKRPEP